MQMPVAMWTLVGIPPSLATQLQMVQESMQSPIVVSTSMRTQLSMVIQLGRVEEESMQLPIAVWT